MNRSSERSRQARLRALAKLNLDLRVLGKRPDHYHELRTVFQTVSLADSLELAFTPASRTAIELEDALAIEDNLAARAARLLLESIGAAGKVVIRLIKRIPMGAGLGGGSSDAAAVLLALPVLAGRVVPLSQLLALAWQLGSDVPFFLMGGRAVGIGRGAELFPLPDGRPQPAVLIAPAVSISTPHAYRRLSSRLTTECEQNKIVSFQSLGWDGGVPSNVCNDFEAVVFEEYPQLARVKRRLIQAGASPALMTGSGSAIFGLFRTGAEAQRALKYFAGERAFRISLVNRTRYRAMWWRALREHIDQRIWPPQSRYAR
jgi:4-diphosphocytidyl-2-C-methyl-D-erythritol kinase